MSKQKTPPRPPRGKERIPSPPDPSRDLDKANRRVGLAVLATVLAMTALSFAAVPLYRVFCSLTGFGGTTQVAREAPDRVLDRTVTVKFNADHASDMPWNFGPERREIRTRLGARTLVAYRAENKGDVPVTGTAVYNVSPPKAGKYFHKIECFCFGEQTLQPRESVSMPVVFYVDPALDEDPDMADLTTITLSYSFFRRDSSDLDRALEDFYNQPSASAVPAR